MTSEGIILADSMRTRDGVLNGAEIVRGPVSFVHPPDITYTDEMEISLGGKRVRLAWTGDILAAPAADLTAVGRSRIGAVMETALVANDPA